MADLPTDDYKFQTYLDSNDNNSEFEGISEQESDVDIPNILESSDDTEKMKVMTRKLNTKLSCLPIFTFSQCEN
jgi:hypothetical protein